MREIWKEIDGYGGFYEVSNTGKVKSYKKTGKGGEGHILVSSETRGYETVGLCDGSGKKKTVLVHRLVASAFVQNPNCYSEVNHIDENKKNNCAENLEWCSRTYNMSYKSARVRQGISCGKPVKQATLNGIVIAVYSSAEMAGKLLQIDPSSIHKCCKGNRENAGGYNWKYSDTNYFSSQ